MKNLKAKRCNKKHALFISDQIGKILKESLKTGNHLFPSKLCASKVIYEVMKRANYSFIPHLIRGTQKLTIIP